MHAWLQVSNDMPGSQPGQPFHCRAQWSIPVCVCGVECLLCRPTRVPAFASSLTSSLAAKFLFASQDSHVSLSLKLCEPRGVCRWLGFREWNWMCKKSIVLCMSRLRGERGIVTVSGGLMANVGSLNTHKLVIVCCTCRLTGMKQRVVGWQPMWTV